MHWRYNFTEVTSNLSSSTFKVDSRRIRSQGILHKTETTFIQAGGPQILLILDFCAHGKPVSIAVLSKIACSNRLYLLGQVLIT